MELAGSRALVTGGGVRLGRAIAIALADAGCDVAVHYWRSAGAATEVVAAILAGGRRSVAVSADLTTPDEPAQLIARVRSQLGGLEVLVNSAALFLPGGLHETDLATWDRQLALNLRAPFLLAQAFAATLPPGRHGRIVNVLDARTRRPGSGHLAYRVSKAALLHLTELLALELAPRVTVNAVAPGAMLPPAGEGAEGFARRVQAVVPLQRPGGVEPVTAAVVFLLRESFATGVTLRVDGGEYL